MDNLYLFLLIAVVSIGIASSQSCSSNSDCTSQKCPLGSVSRCASSGVCQCSPFLVGCSGSMNDGDFALDPDVPDCTAFLRCSTSGLTTNFDCPGTLVFDVRENVCVWNYEGVCPLVNTAPAAPAVSGDSAAAAPPTQTAASTGSCGFITCQNSGTCQEIATSPGFKCVCQPGFTGQFCTEANPCAGQTCSGQGSCSGVAGQAKCTCNPGRVGAFCESQATATLTVSPVSATYTAGSVIQLSCATNNVAGGSYAWNFRKDGNIVGSFGNFVPTYTYTETLNQAGTFKYTCDVASPGILLTSNDVTVTVVPANPCAGQTCSNNGVCSIVSGQAKCTCNKGWTGDFCQTPETGACSFITCQNNGVCSNTASGGFKCTCPNGFSGAFCQIVDGGASIGSACIKSSECAAITGCPSGQAGHCSVPAFTCQCKAVKNIPCTTHSVCNKACAGGFGLCMANGNCDCFSNIENYYASMVINKFPNSPPYIKQ